MRLVGPARGSVIIKAESLMQAIVCFKVNPKAEQYLMEALPKPRVKIPVKRFVGIDYCGPFVVKVGKIGRHTFTKAYI